LKRLKSVPPPVSAREVPTTLSWRASIWSPGAPEKVSDTSRRAEAALTTGLAAVDAGRVARPLRRLRAPAALRPGPRWGTALRSWRDAADPEVREAWWLRLLRKTLRGEDLVCDCDSCRRCRDEWSVEDAPAA
jgi:hypothetical protein